MYKKFILATIAIFILLFTFLSVNRGYFIQNWSFTPFKAYEFELSNLANKKISFKHTPGEVVLLFFWATWCPSCKDDLHFFSEFINSMKNNTVRFISISLDGSSQIVEDSFKSLMFTPNFEVLIDTNGDISAMHDVYSVPETFLINKKGIVVKRFLGSIIPQEKVFLQELNELLTSE